MHLGVKGGCESGKLVRSWQKWILRKIKFWKCLASNTSVKFSIQYLGAFEVMTASAPLSVHCPPRPRDRARAGLWWDADKAAWRNPGTSNQAALDIELMTCARMSVSVSVCANQAIVLPSRSGGRHCHKLGHCQVTRAGGQGDRNDTRLCITLKS